MNLLFLLSLVGLAFFVLNKRDQSVRIALLGSYLGKFHIEKLMETVIDGYMRALGESNAERQAQVWGMLSSAEHTLCEQFNAFAHEFAKVPEEASRVSALSIALPYATKLLAGATFDMREALLLHARGIEAVAQDTTLAQKDKAFRLTAELFLMQHTCHWFCRSKTIASARMVARHKTPYAQLVASVSPATRQAYVALLAGKRP
ncbi:hypothetical protein [Rhodoferax aquaticus]|uniref:Uncharacterized protein n=1 Tax=Rhodoferax aquaticus TaxID=2527691 RepID=A0A515ELF1_9BURK|nr:hypothetical protein [Rhodoferax aquaticus]QDL53464.1 hypothetical protein EXZ61_04325 [Rhodoferax aquaticus]